MLWYSCNDMVTGKKCGYCWNLGTLWKRSIASVTDADGAAVDSSRRAEPPWRSHTLRSIIAIDSHDNGIVGMGLDGVMRFNS